MHDGAADTHAASAKAYEQERSGMDVRQDAQYVSPTIARALGTAPDCTSASAAPRSCSMLPCAALRCTCGPRRVCSIAGLRSRRFSISSPSCSRTQPWLIHERCVSAKRSFFQGRPALGRDTRKGSGALTRYIIEPASFFWGIRPNCHHPPPARLTLLAWDSKSRSSESESGRRTGRPL